MDESEQKVIDDINHHGWYVMRVFDPQGKEPNFAYSIGLYETFKHPEIVVIGLGLDTMHQFINVIGEEIRSGKTFSTGVKYEQFTNNFNNQFVAVDKRHYKEYFGWANWYYKGEDFPVLQFVWPDKNNKFPWEKEFNPELKNWELVLNI